MDISIHRVLLLLSFIFLSLALLYLFFGYLALIYLVFTYGWQDVFLTDILPNWNTLVIETILFIASIFMWLRLMKQLRIEWKR